MLASTPSNSWLPFSHTHRVILYDKAVPTGTDVTDDVLVTATSNTFCTAHTGRRNTHTGRQRSASLQFGLLAHEL